MPFLTNKTAETPVDIFYEDYGSGQPVILIHGWPLSHRAWEPQVPDLVNAGYRVITYDRRGFGLSSFPWDGYDYSSLASDLNEIISQLELKDAVIVGFSMGGGEVVRYFTDYNGKNVAKAALISSIIPLVPRKPDNPNGVPEKDLKDIMESLKSDRVGFLKQFHKNFYNFDDNEGERISKAQLHYDWSIASYASPNATIKTAESWGGTDFRPEMKNVTVPTLIVHGTADNIVPIETAGDQATEGIPDNEYHKIDNAPHGLGVTHKKELNKLLLDFLAK
ncbi:alpha/beta hydrolase [Neolewinella aurantiaca]|uniref:Alpha/beta hydrolase n=1 Tax=Neolewinella aurantiaca TaxID=2602767 RepID=A0A5C7FY83_9BACT|nr:alpha/beta hydrolase [Neolewinella aurantiaca]TXF90581.1 alpha/beta hydrolase [Neolewinella aurantiaca]